MNRERRESPESESDGEGSESDDGILRKPFEETGRVVARHPYLVLALAGVLVLVAFGGASQITSVTGNEAFTGENPTLSKYQEEFGQGFLAAVVRGEVSNPRVMEAIARFDDRLSEANNVRRVITPADRVRERYGRIPDSEAEIREVVGSPDYTVLNVVTAPDLTQKQERPIYESAVEAKRWVRFPSGTDVIITGQPAFGAQLSSLIQKSTGQLLGLAVGLMVIALFFFFRGVRLRLLPIVAVFVGVIYTFGAMGYLGVPNSTLTSAVFPILIGLGIDYSVQFHTRYEEELNRDAPNEALPRALKGVGPPVLVAMVAAGFGFAATAITSIDVPALVWFSETSILGIIFSYLTAVIVLVSSLTIYVRRKGEEKDVERGEEKEGRRIGENEAETDMSGNESRDPDTSDIGTYGAFVGRSSRKLARRPVLVLLVAGLVMVGGLYASEQVGTLTDTEGFVPQDLPALLDLQEFRSVTGGGSAVRYSVLIKGSDLRSPRALRWMEEFSDVAAGKPGITGVESLAGVVKRYNEGEIPSTTAGVKRVLERVPPVVEKRYYSDGYAHLVVLAEQNMNTQATVGFIQNVRTALDFSRPPPGLEAELTGVSVISTGSILESINERNLTTLVGVVLVFFLLVVYYRDLVRATAPIIPMLFVVGWQGIYMYVLGVKISPLSASLGALTVGIGAEYTIIVTERFFEEKRKGASRLDAMEVATSRVGKAITVSGATTVFGFSALTLSPFPLLADFGFITVGIIAMTLVAALVTLPPILVLLDEISEGEVELVPSRRELADTLRGVRGK